MKLLLQELGVIYLFYIVTYIVREQVVFLLWGATSAPQSNLREL
jgi:hypothetical protein